MSSIPADPPTRNAASNHHIETIVLPPVLRLRRFRKHRVKIASRLRYPSHAMLPLDRRCC
jgi:hypothetical protein